MTKKNLLLWCLSLGVMQVLCAQVEPHAGQWKPWLVQEVKTFRLNPPPRDEAKEIAQVIEKQKNLTQTDLTRIEYWQAGAPGYRWINLIKNLWVTNLSNQGALSNLLVGVAIYDATLCAWDTKYHHRRSRPYLRDRRVKVYGLKPDYPAYPCEYAVAAGAAMEIIQHFYPQMKDSVIRMAHELMEARITSGLVYPSDVKAGFTLGQQVAAEAIKRTRHFTTTAVWRGQIPQGKDLWTGPFALLPMAGKNKTMVLDSASQFRPGPPPDFAKDMQELREFKQTFSSRANAYFWADQEFWTDEYHLHLFEHNLHLNPPRAARIYAAKAIGEHDGFTACWDAKYTYWGIRPSQYDTTYRAPLPIPSFPGYPSGHAAISAVAATILSYFFPANQPYFNSKAASAAESRFQAGIHFRTDNEVALVLGRQVGEAIINKLKHDGAESVGPGKQ